MKINNPNKVYQEKKAWELWKLRPESHHTKHVWKGLDKKLIEDTFLHIANEQK